MIEHKLFLYRDKSDFRRLNDSMTFDEATSSKMDHFYEKRIEINTTCLEISGST